MTEHEEGMNNPRNVKKQIGGRPQPFTFKVKLAPGLIEVVEGRFADVENGHLLIKSVTGSILTPHIELTHAFVPGEWQRFDRVQKSES